MPDVVTIIQSVGFPVVCCLGLGYYVKYLTDNNREEIDKMNELHKEEMVSMTEAINNNTLALTKLCERMSNGGVYNEKNSTD